MPSVMLAISFSREHIVQLINPNWHVMFVHFPMALLSMGVLIELFAFLWRNSRVRVAARWMILIGALWCVPTILTGVYAYQDAVREASTASMGEPWRNIVAECRWSAAQWEFMNDHLTWAIVGGCVFVIGAVKWIAIPDAWRRKFHWAFVLWMVIGLAILTMAAWHAGEGIFRYGTAVKHNYAALPKPSLDTWEQKLDYLLPRDQMHVFAAGLAIAVALLALGLTIRRWSEMAAPELKPAEPWVPSDPASPTAPPPTVVPESAVCTGEPPPCPVFPARFWLIAAVLALLTAAGGLWLSRVIVIPKLFTQLDRDWKHDKLRRLVHVIFGVSIFALLAILSLLTRLAPRSRILIGVAGGLLLIAVAVQMWIGVLLLYDDDEGPIRGWRPAEAM